MEPGGVYWDKTNGNEPQEIGELEPWPHQWDEGLSLFRILSQELDLTVTMPVINPFYARVKENATGAL